jgi:hypothetical protein
MLCTVCHATLREFSVLMIILMYTMPTRNQSIIGHQSHPTPGHSIIHPFDVANSSNESSSVFLINRPHTRAEGMGGK